MEDKAKEAADTAKSTKETVTEKVESLKAEATEQISAASEKLGELKDQVVNKVNG
jgi:F0F1-type ATP synthase membrane subunit b/b'